MIGSATAALLPVDVVLERVQTDPLTGLSSDEVLQRQRLHGPNELEAEKKITLFQRFLDKRKEPLIMLLLVSAIVSAALRQFDDAVAITMAVAIVLTVAIIQEYKSDQSLEALSKLAPPFCRVMRDSAIVEVTAAALVPGDIVVLAVGDRVPADLRLVASVDLAVDESSLTGENEPALKASSLARQAAALSIDHATPLGVLPVAERSNCAFMGTLVRVGRGSGVVVAAGMATELGLVFGMLGRAGERKSPLQVRGGAAGSGDVTTTLSASFPPIIRCAWMSWASGSPSSRAPSSLSSPSTASPSSASRRWRCSRSASRSQLQPSPRACPSSSRSRSRWASRWGRE